MLSSVQTAAPRSVAVASTPRLRAPNARQMVVTKAYAESSKAPVMAAAAMAASMLMASPVFAGQTIPNPNPLPIGGTNSSGATARVADSVVRPAICASNPTSDICARNSANPSTPDNTVKTNVTSPVAMVNAPPVAIVADLPKLNPQASPKQALGLSGAGMDTSASSTKTAVRESVVPVEGPFSSSRPNPVSGTILGAVNSAKDSAASGENGGSDVRNSTREALNIVKKPPTATINPVWMVAEQGNSGSFIDGIKNFFKQNTNATPSGNTTRGGRERAESDSAFKAAEQQSAAATEGAKGFVPIQASNKDLTLDQVNSAPAPDFKSPGAIFLKGEK